MRDVALTLSTEEVQHAYALSRNPVTGVADRLLRAWIDWLKENQGPVRLIEYLESDADRMRALACEYVRTASPSAVHNTETSNPRT